MSAAVLPLTTWGTAEASAAPTLPKAGLSIVQVPNAGVSLEHNVPKNSFTAPLAATATGPNTIRVWITPNPARSCRTTLADARIGITWRNNANGASGSNVFAACQDGGPALSPDLRVGRGPVSFTTTILGRGGETFTVSPGSGTIVR
ncbi:MAG: hypothetical protein QM673_09650 [Gordonia sp. (in: high G+C Gram-positive bacteria)]